MLFKFTLMILLWSWRVCDILPRVLRKSFSLVYTNDFTKWIPSCHELRVMILLLVAPILNRLFSFLSPSQTQDRKEQRPEELWPEVNTSSLYRHHPQRLSGLELVILWQRTPSPGLTVKGGRNVLRALHSVGVCAWVGEGSPSSVVCNEKLLPSTGPGLKPSLKPGTGNLSPPH